MPHVVVVGAGIGGLAAAGRLARAGWEVTVVEKTAGPGGRCQTVRDGGYAWDLGPTILLYPDLVAAHFRELGARVEDYIELVRLDPRYRVRDEDGTLTFHDDLAKMRDELGADYDGYLRLLDLARRQEEIAFGTFLARPFRSAREALSPRAVAGVVRGRALESVWSVVSAHVRQDRVRRALTFQTMYLGLSPFEAPGLFTLLLHAEAAHGVFHVRGGVGSIGTALARLAEEAGARIRYRCAARRVIAQSARVAAVELEGGERLACDSALVNVDWPTAQRALLGRRAARNWRVSSSAYVLLLGCARRWEHLAHHNLSFGGDYRESFLDLFARRRLPREPSFYVADAAHTDPSLAPAGKSALYVLVPVPSLSAAGPDWTDAGTRRGLRDAVIARMEHEGARGLAASIEVVREVTPLDWERDFGLHRGAAFGLAHTLTQVGALRPGPRDRRIQGLYYVGASVQPATGIPNVLLGARMAAQEILEAR